uniref:Uncharacterized protein n=1 Tax=Solanum lycopersicum TaxID=4081 RepID=A0A3Q7EPI3_SOLLC
MTSLQWLDLGGNPIDELPDSIKNLTRLKTLNIACCTKIKYLEGVPSNVTDVNADGCIGESYVQDDITSLFSLSPKKLPPQILYHRGVFSTFLPGESVCPIGSATGLQMQQKSIAHYQTTSIATQQSTD